MSAWDRLRAFLGLQKAYASSPSAIIGPTPLSWQLARIGGSLTPQSVSSILRRADTGYVDQLIDLENESRQKDCHLQSILGTREQAVAGLGFEIVPIEGEKAKKRDKDAAEWCAEKLSAVDCFHTLISHLQGAVYHSFAVAETIWTKDGADIVPLKFIHEAPRRFIFDDKESCLHWWDVNNSMPYPGVDVAKKYPGKFIVHQPRVNGDVAVREGLGRVLMWAALFRNWDMRDWLELAELAWKPWRSGKYTKNASKEDIAALINALDRMTTSGVAALPETTELEVMFPPGGGKSNHSELMAFLGAEMSKAVLGQTTTVEQGERGSEALGKVHNEVRKDIRDNDAKQLAATLRRDLLTPMIRQNFGPAVQVPLFRFLTEDALDLALFANAVSTLQGAGLKIPACHVYDVTGIPEPKDGEALLEVEVDTSELEEPPNGGEPTEPTDPEMPTEQKPEPEPKKKPKAKPKK